MGLKRGMWVLRYQGQCRALRPLGHQGTGFAVTTKINHYAAVTHLCGPHKRASHHVSQRGTNLGTGGEEDDWFPVRNGALITPPIHKLSGHVSAGRFQPVCLRPGSALSQDWRGTALSLSSVRYLLNLNY